MLYIKADDLLRVDTHVGGEVEDTVFFSRIHAIPTKPNFEPATLANSILDSICATLCEAKGVCTTYSCHTSVAHQKLGEHERLVSLNVARNGK